VLFLAGVALCYVLLAAATTLVGLAFMAWVLPLDGLDSADSGPVEWLAERRTPFLDALSYVGSEISGGFVIPAIVGAVAIISAFQRRWLLAGFVLAAIILESATYRTTVFFVDRERPDVERLEGLPADASFPSGHVAASIAVYSGFALLLTSRMSSTRAKVLVWAAALAIPLIVAVSRMYRGMHHPLDTLAGVLIGIAALALALLLARATRVVSRRREGRPA
jgi:undecaprenyl-diphosphatase